MNNLGYQTDIEEKINIPTKIPYNQMINEHGYIQTLNNILEHGNIRGDRTGTGTISLFGVQMRFDISSSFPLLTTKRVPFNMVAEELFWFLRGSTDNSELQKKNINIWNLNSNRNFLDSLGFYDREENDIGPGYGFQWRHFGAKYNNCKTDYTNQGVDQIKEIIELLKNDPNSRRIILSGWNPMDIKNCNLPPCHCLTQFYVDRDNLSCCLYQRSGDMALGVPFNIASYSLLTYILADMTGLKPKEFVHNIGDAHIYLNHINGVKEQITREPYMAPQLYILNHHENIEEYEIKDFNLCNYKYHPYIPFKMAV